MCVGVVEKLKEALVDHVFSDVDKEQWHHVLQQVGQVLEVAEVKLRLFPVD